MGFQGLVITDALNMQGVKKLFIDSNIVKTKGSQISNRYLNTLIPAYKLNGYFVWGATAMILSEVKDI